MRALIVFYSRTGTTERVAGLLADRLRHEGVEVDIRPARTATPLGIVGCIRLMRAKACPTLTEPVPDASGYDLVLLGFPVWGDCPASPVDSILGGLKSRAGQRFAVFATSGMKGGFNASLAKVSARLAEMGCEVVASRGFLWKERLSATEQGVAEFARQIAVNAGQ